jgi:3-hydroxyacyl-CoA dehydrogenase/enoyl-CoA hydratase/3-hydroxybutyryl-CoA epimerase
VLDQTRADFRAEGKTYIATPGELLVERMVKEFDRNGRAAGGGFYEYPQEKGAKKVPLARTRPCSAARCEVGHATT